jgi:poly(A) polymerase
LNTAAARVTSDQLNPEALAYWLGKERAVDRLLLGEGDANALANWVSPIFPLTGGAIVARGVLAGPEVARILSVVEHQWVAEGFPDAGRVSAIADAVIAR